ncbi:cation transporter [Ralstonia pickettii]|uniref:cation transporter n=1 Tax=Ralstonia pickettii TaxID=329 RepID=UPI003857B3B9
MFTDAAALAIALAAIQIGKRPADKQRNVGYYRFERFWRGPSIALLLFGVARTSLRGISALARACRSAIVGHAGDRHHRPRRQHRQHASSRRRREQSLNIKGAYLEV